MPPLVKRGPVPPPPIRMRTGPPYQPPKRAAPPPPPIGTGTLSSSGSSGQPLGHPVGTPVPPHAPPPKGYSLLHFDPTTTTWTATSPIPVIRGSPQYYIFANGQWIVPFKVGTGPFQSTGPVNRNPIGQPVGTPSTPSLLDLLWGSERGGRRRYF